MSAREQQPRWAAVLTTLLAFALQVIPVPEWLGIVRPAFAVLAVIYWSVAAPHAGGIALGFITGLALDIFKGAVLGQYAFGLSLVAYLASRDHQVLRNKPVFEQSLLVAAALAIYEVVAWSIDGWSGHPMSSATRWVHILTGAAIWPLIAGLFGRYATTR